MSIRIGNAPCSWGVEFADPAGPTSLVEDARANRAYLRSIDFN